MNMIINIISTIALLVITGILLHRFVFRKSKGSGFKNVDTPAIVAAIRRIAELSTASFIEQKVITDKRKHTFSDDRICLIVTGHIRAGYDFKEMDPVNGIEIKNGILTIKLPEVKILDVIINPKDTCVFDEEGEYWNKTGWVDKRVLESKESIKEDAIKEGILTKAEEYGETKIRALFMTFGLKDVIIEKTLENTTEQTEEASTNN